MKKLKKLSVAIVALAMCALLGISVWAANWHDVSYTATFDNANLCVTNAVQEATMTVRVSSKVDMDSFTAQLIVPEGLTVKEVTFGDLTNAIYDETENMIIWWSTSADNVSNDILAVVTVEVPANAKETYEIGFEITDISSGYGNVWETGETVYATLTVADHEWNEPTYTDNGDGTHTANYTCKNNERHTKSDAPAPHDFTTGTCVCGKEEPVTNISVVYKGNALASAYKVDGNVVTVTFAKACKIGYLDATTGKYVAISAVSNVDGSYSFTAPEGVTEVLLVVKGDVTGDGNLNVLDRVRLSKALLAKNNANYEALTEAWQVFVANANDDSNLNVLDRVRLSKALLAKNNANYDPFVW